MNLVLVGGCLIGACVVLLFLWGFCGSVWKQLRELRDDRALSHDEARLVWGTCVLVRNAMYGFAILTGVAAWPLGMASVTIASITITLVLLLAGVISKLGVRRMQASRRGGGWAPKHIGTE